MSDQWYYGWGDIYSIEASENITSGVAVAMAVGGKAKICQTSDSAFGVSQIPASDGEPLSVIRVGIVRVLNTGGNAVAGQYAVASNGAMMTRTYKAPNVHVLGLQIETGSVGAKSKIKLGI